MVLALLCAAQFVAVLGVTIVAVALPAIKAGLGFTGSSLQWVVTAYTVVYGGLLIPAGRAADAYGRRRLFRIGLALFAAASVGCGLAGSPGALIALRALQGLGAALLAPAALALVAELFPDDRRAIAVWTAAAAGGGAAGWVLGGTLTDDVGWQAVFLVNAPLGVAAVIAAGRLLPAGTRGEGAQGLDLPGAAAVTVGLVALLLGLTVEPAALVVAAVALAVFAAVERRAPDPLVPGDRTLIAACLVGLALTASTSPAMFLSVLYQQDELGRSAALTGLACAP